MFGIRTIWVTFHKGGQMSESDGSEPVNDAEDAQRRNFPVLPASHWWAFRKRFKQSIPSTIDPKFVATSLAMTEASARSNVLPALRAFGIIDANGKTNQPLAARWRDDTEYPKVCAEFIAKAYPKSLREVAPNPLEEKETVKRWFGSHGVGEGMITKASSLYFLLCEADPSKANEPTKREPSAARKSPEASKARAAKQPADSRRDDGQSGDSDRGGSEAEAARAAAAEAQAKLLRKAAGPQLHLNVQVHISPETTPDQIEAIFASMAKHLKTLSE